MNCGSKAEVLEPELLRDEIRTEAEVIIERYSTGEEKGGRKIRH